jgi:hypothetical protein
MIILEMAEKFCAIQGVIHEELSNMQ